MAHRGIRSRLLIGVAALAAPAIASAQHAVVPAPAAGQAAATPAPERRVTLNVRAVLNGSPLGDLTVETDATGNTNVDAGQLARLLAPVASRETLAGLNARAGGAVGLVPINVLANEAFRIRFDLATLTVQIDIPVDARAISQISILNPRGFNQATVAAPSNFSAGVTFNLGVRIRQGGFLDDFSREPLTSLAQGYVNIGGKNGIYATFLGGFSEGGSPVRQRTTIFHDDERHAIRYSAGDIDPQTFGSYYAPTSLFGLSIERLYQEIQPYRNIRPAGLGSVAIERDSRVDVIVNGTLYRTINLTPGQYSLRDFPFLDGLNDVQLVVRDDSGRQETIGLSFFSDTQLLDPGLSLFSVAAGFRRDRFSDFINTTYRDTPTITGFYQRGITDRLTLGGAVQADRRNLLVSGQAVIGTPIGLIGAEAALDLHSGERVETALLVSYRLRERSSGGNSNSASIDVQYRSAGFSPLESDVGVINRFSIEANARYQRTLGQSTYASVGAGYSIGRGAQPNITTFSAGLSRRFHRLNVSLDYTYRQNSATDDHRATISLTLPLSSRQSVRARYDTERNRVGVDYNLQGSEGLGQTNARISAGRDDLGQYANLDVEHFSNRFRAVLRHDYEQVGGQTSQLTDLGLSFGVGFADGRLALGRDAARGFTIVAGHPSLQGATIVAKDSFSSTGSARTGVFGPALVPTRRPYAFNSIEVTVPHPPPGYDIGSGRLDILPGAASGYLFTVGSAASLSVLGTIVNASGAPMALISGTMEPLSGADARPVQFFTNRTGRMAATGVAPGRYRLVRAGTNAVLGEIEVPANPGGPVNFGTLRVEE